MLKNFVELVGYGLGHVFGELVLAYLRIVDPVITSFARRARREDRGENSQGPGGEQQPNN